MIVFQALGASDLRRSDDNRLLSLLSKPKRLALLAYLTQATPRGFHRRDKLVTLLWPDLDHQHARTALRKALHFLRGVLGPLAIKVRGDEVAVSRQHVWCDAVAFDEAAQSGEHARALELYRGPLLEGLHVSRAIEFERWLEAERRRLRRAAVLSALSGAKDRQVTGDHPAAVEWVRRAIRIEPYREASYQELIRLLDRIGDRAAAVSAFRELKDRLATDLDLSPAPETRALIRAVRARGDVSSGNAPAPTGNDGVEISDTEAVPSGSLRWPYRRFGGRLRLAAVAVLVAPLIGLLAIGTTPVKAPSAASTAAVAVLPFQNVGPSPSDDYIARGIANEIITQLSKTGSLRVTPRSSLRGLASEARDLQEIGRELGVTFIVDGTVQRYGTRLRITVHFVDARRPEQLWAERYDHSLGDILTIQEDVAREVAASLTAVFTPWPETRPRATPAEDLPAYSPELR